MNCIPLFKNSRNGVGIETRPEIFRRTMRYLINNLGESAVENKIRQVERSLTVERGLISEIMHAENEFWLGLKEFIEAEKSGKTFNGPYSKKLHRALLIAVFQRVLYKTFSQKTLEDSCCRILRGADLEAIFYEYSMAARFYAFNWNISWDVPKNSSDRSFDFWASDDNVRFQVECKSKRADAGRQIKQKELASFLDELLKALNYVPRNKVVRVAFKKGIPNSKTDQALFSAYVANCLAGHETKCIEEVKVEIMDFNFKSQGLSSLQNEIKSIKQPQETCAVFFSKEFNKSEARSCILVSSQSPDDIHGSIREALSDAWRQFSPGFPAIILINLPGINSFKGLESESCLSALTQEFFVSRRTQDLYSVIYTSDEFSQFVPMSSEIVSKSGRPLLFFSNQQCFYQFPNSENKYFTNNSMA